MQQECIPQAKTGTDMIVQAKAGTGKTAVFVLSTLQQIVVANKQLDVLVLCHTHELAYQVITIITIVFASPHCLLKLTIRYARNSCASASICLM